MQSHGVGNYSLVRNGRREIEEGKVREATVEREGNLKADLGRGFRSRFLSFPEVRNERVKTGWAGFVG
jgi:hypothetical protein